MSIVGYKSDREMSVAVGPGLAAYINEHGILVDDELGGHVYQDPVSVHGPSGAFNRAIVEALGGHVGIDPEYSYKSQAWFPGPDRLAANAVLRGYAIRLESDGSGPGGGIKPTKYGAIVESDEHPVSVYNHKFYWHDTTPTDHMGTVITLGSALFSLYKGRYSNLIDLADLHDKFTGGTRSMGEALAKLVVRQEVGRFNIVVDEELPHLLGRRVGPTEHDTALSLRIRQLTSAGLNRLGIDHPDILRLSDSNCGICYYHGVRRPQTARPF